MHSADHSNFDGKEHHEPETKPTPAGALPGHQGLPGDAEPGKENGGPGTGPNPDLGEARRREPDDS
ncbi:MAG: hypothetical protein K2X93_26400 [Candidatus Obscuribacterales bacterium]|nr:hypothetical protein [Candidatus Obscuribacterales bacterium]